MGGASAGSARDYPPRPILGVGAIAFQDGRVLLVRRGNEPARGLWSVPGGAVKLGETVKEALSREVAEESGLKIKVGPLVAVLDRIFHDSEGRVQFHYVLLDYLCTVLSGELKAGSDASGVRLATLEELKSMRLTKGTRKVILAAKALANKWSSTAGPVTPAPGEPAG